MMVLPFEAFAQNQVKGRIVDEAGQPVVGAMVLNKDNGKWATTDIDGNYTLENAAKGNNLEITCLGYSTQNIVFQGSASLNVTLAEDTLELEEAVAIGYGSVKKKDLTGSVGILSNKLIEQQSTTQLSQSLQGTIPGLSVTRSSSMPGASASILVRGVTSMSDSSPLVLVDGMPGSLDNVASGDVEQITVLKDAASASIYGARAAAGVILITTKNAKEGDVNINYNGEFSVITATEWAEYLRDPINYMTMFNEYKWNDAGNGEGGDYVTYPKDYIENYMANNAMDPITYPDFDWKGNILRNYSTRQKHTLSVAYGNKVVKTRVSASYENTDALYEGSNYERIMARTRNSVKISNSLSADVDFSFKTSTKLDPLTTPIQAANMYPSIYLGLFPDGRVAEGKSGSNTLGTILNGGRKTNRTDYVTAKASLTWKPFEGFSLSGSIAPTYALTKTKTFSKAVPYFDAYDTTLILGYVSGHATNDLTETRNDNNSFETQIIANYENSFNNAHNINLMAGYEDYSYSHESFSTSTAAMDLGNFPYMDLANPDNLTVTGDAYGNAYRSFFGRVMYNYKGRYYFQANARADASSRFHKDYRWGFFPSASIGWVISNESFMQSVTPINYLKLRASLGTLGNERIGNYPYQASIDFNKAVMFKPDGKDVTSQISAAQSGYAIQDISWETTWSYDFGLDATLLDNRLSLTADYYYKETKDMLLALEIPAFLGYDNPDQNAGSMYTNGWEVKIDWHDQIGDFSYAVGANLSDYRSIMGNLNGKQVIGSDTIIREGEEYQSWYGYKNAGLFQNQDEVLNAATQLIPTAGPGDIQYLDLGGAPTDEQKEAGILIGDPDGKINSDYDRTILGSSLPHYIFGGYVNLGWKNWSLGIMFNGVGKQLSHVAEYMVRPFGGQWLSAPANLLNADGSRNYWSVYNSEEQNRKVEYPRLSYTSAEKTNYMMSDYWLFNGSYFRVKNINLGYTLPRKTVDKMGIKGLRVYLNSDDPLCFDHYLKGWDPEQTTQSYIARTFTLGVDIKF